MKAGARRDGGGGEGGDGGGRGGGGHEAGSLQAEETYVAAARSLRNIVGVSRRDRSGEVGPAGRTCCAGPGRGDARPPPYPRAPLHAPRPLVPGAGTGADEGQFPGLPGPGALGARWKRVRRDKGLDAGVTLPVSLPLRNSKREKPAFLSNLRARTRDATVRA